MNLRKLWFSVFKQYRRLEYRCVSYDEGDRLIRESAGKPESEQWVLAEEEDFNLHIGLALCLQRRERIRE